MKAILRLILFTCILCPLQAKSIALNWPLLETNIIKSGANCWQDKFYGNKDSNIFAYSIESEKIIENHIYTFSINPEHIKIFQLMDVNVITGWNNHSKTLEMVVLDKNDKVVVKDIMKLNDQVDDLDLRFGQGRRPAFLFIKKSGNQNQASIWFDEREQTIFLQDSPIIASILHWSSLSSYIVSTSAMKSFIKVWQKGMINSYEIPFLPLVARFILIDNNVILLAIDSKGNLWRIHISENKIITNKLMSNPDLVFVKQLDLIQGSSNMTIFMQSAFKKKIYIYKTSDIHLPANTNDIEEHAMIDENIVFPGRISENIAWLESNASRHTYLNRENEKLQPVVDLNWFVSTKEGYPQIFFTWGSLPRNKQYEYRYIIDNKENSPPLPEYRLKENKLNARLSSDGKFFLHIQAIDPVTNQESLIYHIPVFWQYHMETPELYLLNEISPFVVSGKSIYFIIENIAPVEYYAEINNIPVYDPGIRINPVAGEVQIDQTLKPGRYYIHIRSKDMRTGGFSATLHYLFFYQTYITEFTVGASDYNKDLGKLNDLLNQYRNAQSLEDKDKILKDLELLKNSLEQEISR